MKRKDECHQIHAQTEGSLLLRVQNWSSAEGRKWFAVKKVEPHRTLAIWASQNLEAGPPVAHANSSTGNLFVMDSAATRHSFLSLITK